MSFLCWQNISNQLVGAEFKPSFRYAGCPGPFSQGFSHRHVLFCQTPKDLASQVMSWWSYWATNFSGMKVTDVGSFYDSWRKPGAPYPSPSLIFQVPFAPPVLPGAKKHECFYQIQTLSQGFFWYFHQKCSFAIGSSFSVEVHFRWFFFCIQISLGKTFLTISVFFSASAVASVSVTSLSFHPLDVKNELKDM